MSRPKKCYLLRGNTVQSLDLNSAQCIKHVGAPAAISVASPNEVKLKLHQQKDNPTCNQSLLTSFMQEGVNQDEGCSLYSLITFFSLLVLNEQINPLSTVDSSVIKNNVWLMIIGDLVYVCGL